MRCVFVLVCFFFQAEDGIRDGHVTGVQTCALPILKLHDVFLGGEWMKLDPWNVPELDVISPEHRPIPVQLLELTGSYAFRSEERRVGKECRSWWWPYR